MSKSPNYIRSYLTPMTAQTIIRPPVPGTRKRGGAKNLPVATWNVRSLNGEGKLENLLLEMKRLRIELLGVAETHWTDEMEGAFEQEGWAIIHSARRDGVRRQGVAIVMAKKWADSLTTYEQISPRMIKATYDVEGGKLSVFQVYAPDSSYGDEEYVNFLDELQERLNLERRSSRPMIMGDFNAKVGGDQYENWQETVGRFGLGQANDRGLALLQFCAINDMVVCNTLFQHKNTRRATWISPDGQTRTQIDFILVERRMKGIVKNCRVYNSADVGSDHSMVVATMNLLCKRPRRTRPTRKRYNVDKLITDVRAAEEFEVQIGGRFEALLEMDTNEDHSIEELYTKFKEETNKVTEEVVGMRRNRQVEGMSDDEEELCALRREARIKMINNRHDAHERENYRTLNRRVKEAVKQRKNQELEKKVIQMETDFRQNNSHKLFKTVRELEGKLRKRMNTVRDINGEILTKKEDVMKRWKGHFERHLNTRFPHEEAALDEIEINQIEDDDQRGDITREEVLNAIKRMKVRKSPGVDDITAEVLRAGGEAMVNMLWRIFNKVWAAERVPRDWAKMLVTPIHKKGNKLEPSNYRAISLLSIPGKVFWEIMLQRMKPKLELFMSRSQFGFRPGKGTVDAIFILRQLMEKAKEHDVPLHINFVDFKSAFDTVWREALWKMLGEAQIDRKIISLIRECYDQTQCAVTVDGNMTEWFGVEVGVRQGCSMSPSLFNVFLEFVMRELTGLDEELHLVDTMSADIRYADDTTLLAAEIDKLQDMTTELEEACRKWGMRVNADKCKIISPEDRLIEIDGETIEHSDTFIYLGSVVPGTEEDVNRRIALAASSFGRLRKTVWSRRDLSRRLKVRLYNALILPIAIYASETWTLRAEETRKLEVFEMRCLRAILGVTLRDRLRNERVRRELGLESTITDIIKKKRNSWFGHVVRRPQDEYIAVAYRGNFENQRPRGRPPKRWRDQIREDTGLPLPTVERNILRERARRGGADGGEVARGRRGLRN